MSSRSFGNSTLRLGALAIAYVLFASIVTHLPLSGRLQRLIGMVDKPLHFLLYAMMVVVVSLALARRRRGVVIACGIALVMATLDEVLQGFIPSRQVELMDWVAGVAGSLFGGLAMMAWYGSPTQTNTASLDDSHTALRSESEGDSAS